MQNGGSLDLTIDGDDFAEHDAGFDPGQTFEARALNVGAANTLCVNLQNNTAPDGYSLEQFNASQTVNVFTSGGWDLHGSGLPRKLPERAQRQQQHGRRRQPGDGSPIRERLRNGERRRGRLSAAESAVAERRGRAMAEPFLSEIRIMSFDFAPKGWALCNGQLLPINQNQALFSLLGTTFGGDGRVNFALPDLRGRTPIHVGAGTRSASAAASRRTRSRSPSCRRTPTPCRP